MRDSLLGYLKGIGESRYRASELHSVRGKPVWLGGVEYGSFLSQRLGSNRASAVSAVVTDTFSGPCLLKFLKKNS